MALFLRVFTGPMWSGKTSALIKTVSSPSFHPRVPRVAIRHSLDTRSPPGTIRARTGEELAGVAAAGSLAHIPARTGHVYAIDEAQFFGDELLSFWERVCEAHLAAPGGTTGLVVAGLDLDFQRREFGAVMKLCRAVMGSTAPDGLAVLHTDPGAALDFHFGRLTARCSHMGAGTSPCNEPACYSQRLAEGGTGTVCVGGAQYYQPACPAHHSPLPIPLHEWDHSHAAERLDDAPLRR